MGRTSFHRCWLLVLLLVLFLCPARQADAVVVYKRGSNKPIAGHLIRESNKEVVVREETPAGEERDVVIPKSEIEDLIETVSPQRLAALDPARPQEYREYAEELAEKRLDPEARLTAVRLFQIAAWLDPAKTGRGALLGLVSLARSGEEEARFRAAAYLFDPRHDKALLGQASSSALSGPRRDEDPAQSLLAALHLLRRGHGLQARAAATTGKTAEELESYNGIMTREEFLAACSVKELSDNQLRKVLELELALDSRLQGRSEQPLATTIASWSDVVRGGSLAPLQSLSFDKLTPFDPRESVFRGGKWQRPDAIDAGPPRKRGTP